MCWSDMTMADVGEMEVALDDKADRFGECDRCYSPRRPLWDDHTERGEWSYCKQCWRQILRVVRGRLARDIIEHEDAA